MSQTARPGLLGFADVIRQQGHRLLRIAELDEQLGLQQRVGDLDDLDRVCPARRPCSTD